MKENHYYNILTAMGQISVTFLSFYILMLIFIYQSKIPTLGSSKAFLMPVHFVGASLFISVLGLGFYPQLNKLSKRFKHFVIFEEVLVGLVIGLFLIGTFAIIWKFAPSVVKVIIQQSLNNTTQFVS